MPDIATITKVFRFEAAHHLEHHDGKCRRAHGHSYKLEVTVAGPVKPVLRGSGGPRIFNPTQEQIRRMQEEAMQEDAQKTNPRDYGSYNQPATSVAIQSQERGASFPEADVLRASAEIPLETSAEAAENEPFDSDVGMVMDFADLSSVVKARFIDQWDHRDLNLVCGVYPTAENLAILVHRTLAEELSRSHPSVAIVRVRLWETETSFATVETGWL